MNTPLMANRTHAIAVKPLILALMLSGPATGLAASMRDVVSSRADQPAVQTYGRDSVYAVTTSGKQMQVAHSGSGKSYNATSAQKASRHYRAEAEDMLSNEVPVRPQDAVFVGESGVAGISGQATAGISTAPDMPVVAYKTVPNRDADHLRPALYYRRDDIDASLSPVAEETDRRSETDIAAQSEANNKQQSETEAPPVFNRSEVETPLEPDNGAYQVSDDGSDVSTSLVNEPASSDERNGRQSEPVVRALADQEPLIPTEELIDDSRHFYPMAVALIERATIIENLDSEAAEGLAGTSIDSNNQDETLLDGKITVTAIEEDTPKRSIRMIKRMKH